MSHCSEVVRVRYRILSFFSGSVRRGLNKIMEHKLEELSAERIVILDFASGKVYIRFVPLSMIENDADEIVSSLGLPISESNCHYMVVNDEDFLDDNTK